MLLSFSRPNYLHSADKVLLLLYICCKAAYSSIVVKTSISKKLFSVVTIAALLTACSGQGDRASTASDPKTPETTSPSKNQKADANASSDADDIESAYTDLNLEDCEVLETYEESGGMALRCEGYQGIPLYVTESDIRFDVDAGVPNDEWTTANRPFNSIGDTVEWRLQGGQPVAAILRYNFESGGSPNVQSSELAVFTIGQEGDPGCLVDWVTADAEPSQNVAARQIADRDAKTFDCSSRSAAASPNSTQLPDAVLGTFDTTQAQCSEPGTSMAEVTISPDKLDFYGGDATVNSVIPQENGYVIDATYYQREGVPEVSSSPAEYFIEPAEDGVRLEWRSEGFEPKTLVRCD